MWVSVGDSGCVSVWFGGVCVVCVCVGGGCGVCVCRVCV